MLRKELFFIAIKIRKILHERARRFFKRELIECIEKKRESELVSPRVFEYSFVIKNLPEKGRIVEIGCTASSNALPITLAELGYEVYGLDLRLFRVKHNGFEFIICDARHLSVRKNIFDCCYSISAIEHIGLPMECGPKNDLEGDSKAIKEMINVVKPNGSLIITVPFGKSHVLAGYERIYDIEGIKSLFEGLEIVEEEYIIERDGVWLKTPRNKAAKADHKPGRRAIGMFKLVKVIDS